MENLLTLEPRRAAAKWFTAGAPSGSGGLPAPPVNNFGSSISVWSQWGRHRRLLPASELPFGGIDRPLRVRKLAS